MSEKNDQQLKQERLEQIHQIFIEVLKSSVPALTQFNWDTEQDGEKRHTLTMSVVLAKHEENEQYTTYDMLNTIANTSVEELMAAIAEKQYAISYPEDEEPHPIPEEGVEDAQFTEVPEEEDDEREWWINAT